MLVLSRRKEETILIGNEIVITILKPKKGDSRNMVRIGIDAPKEVLILRGELTAQGQEPPTQEAE